MEELLGSTLDGGENLRLEGTEFVGQFLVQLSLRNSRGKLLFRSTSQFPTILSRQCSHSGPENQNHACQMLYGDSFEENDPVIFTISDATGEVLSLNKRSEDQTRHAKPRMCSVRS